MRQKELKFTLSYSIADNEKINDDLMKYMYDRRESSNSCKTANFLMHRGFVCSVIFDPMIKTEFANIFL